MEDYYRMDYNFNMQCSDEDMIRADDFHGPLNEMVQMECAVVVPDISDLTKAQIATHPLYPKLLSAYIQCQKVGAPPEIATLLEEIGRENCLPRSCFELGADPELDEFMESYCGVLHRYKEELSRPFDEATSFLSSIESQLSHLCIDSSTMPGSEEAAGSSDEELSGGEVERPEHQSHQPCVAAADNSSGIKEVLLKKYSGYLSNLRKEFLKKRKNGKLPKEARMTLLDWWNSHYRWPYPTEEEKMKLSQLTGLDQKQINNWFINQRKRHWKPSEELRFALMEGASGSVGASAYDHNVEGELDSSY